MSHLKNWLKVLSVLFLFCALAKLHTNFQISAQTPEPTASLLFVPESISTTADDQFTTQLWIDTDGASVGGVGAKITFNPALLSVEKIETQKVFPDYPATTFDNTSGNIVISGIVRSKEELYTGKGHFATITWKSKGAGDSTIAFNFVPNSTNDSNIAVLYGNGDILQKTNTVTVHSTAAVVAKNQTPDSTSTPAPPVTIDQQTKTTSSTGFFSLGEKILAFAVFCSLIFQVFLYFKIRKIERYKEAIPHLHTP